MSSTKPGVYGYPLPENWISFTSKRGKNIFKAALDTEYMNCYYKLAGKFKSQEAPWTCGTSSLIMVLNALEVDPGVIWKGEFRWYHEDMLDWPGEDTSGISMDGVCCLALCNQLDVEMERVNGTSKLSDFREVLKKTTSNDEEAMIVSYYRNKIRPKKHRNKTKSGHFSPIGGYSEKEDMVLIFDVARYKYPLHWLSMEDLWSAMNSPDNETGLNRGYMVVRKREEND